jgi:4-diphosphocytidyl-2-C-methyl-D-erythritol kinase
MLKPDVHISTREAYAGIRLSADQPSLAALVRSGITPIDLVRHADIIFNDFERTVFPLHPELAAIKQNLLNAGAVYAAMSGSGSACFGIFPKE